jgi:hypothetical protein
VGLLVEQLGGDVLQRLVQQRAIGGIAAVPVVETGVEPAPPRRLDSRRQDPNARVEYTRDHFSEHLTLDAIGAPRVLLWLKDRFAGAPVAAGCSTSDVGSMMMLDPVTWQVWEQTRASLSPRRSSRPSAADAEARPV